MQSRKKIGLKSHHSAQSQVWQQADQGVAYASKLDDFESFVAHAKLAGLALGPSTASLAAGTANAAATSPPSQQVFLAITYDSMCSRAEHHHTYMMCMPVDGEYLLPVHV